MPNDAYGAVPGMRAARVTSEKVVWWGREENNLYLSNRFIDAAAVDAGNTPTTELRAGLILGLNSSSGTMYAWDPDGTNGTQIVDGVLLRDISMLDVDGVAEAKSGHMLQAGRVKAADLLIQGTAFTTSTAEWLARRQMLGSGRFQFDDQFSGQAVFLGPPQQTLNVTATGSVTADQTGSLFVVVGSGAVTLTLPTLEAGLVFEFFNSADQNLSVASVAGNDIVTVNDLAASSITASTSSQKIGAHFRVQSGYLGSTLKWFATNLSVGVTMTVA